METLDFLVSKTELEAVIISLEIRRDAIIKTQKRPDVVDDLNELSKMLKRVRQVHVIIEKENRELRSKLFQLRNDKAILESENHELQSQNTKLMEGWKK